MSYQELIIYGLIVVMVKLLSRQLLVVDKGGYSLPPGVVLRLENVSVVYKMPRGIARVVDNITIDIYEGKITGIVGESGSGKSMLAGAMLRAVPRPGKIYGRVLFRSKTYGVVDILGIDKEKLRRIRWKEIAMVFQGAQNSFNPVIRIKDHFIDTAMAHGWDDEEAVLDKASKLLEMVKLEPDRVLEAYPHQLSGGMKQRVLIALSLLLDPYVLILDEPTSALDTISQKVIVDLLRDIHERTGITMIFITHDLPLISSLVDYVAIMYGFKIVEYMSIEELIRRPLHPYTKGLIRSIPPVHGDLSQVRPIPGTHPDPIEPPPGCRFSPRCPVAEGKCLEKHPELVKISENHFVACHKWSLMEGFDPWEKS